jgi:hypothetical protein
MHGQYMCFLFVLQAWFVATTINLWTSDMYDGSSLDKLYIQNILSRDGNGDPIPDSPRGVPPLEDGDGEETSPAGI